MTRGHSTGKRQDEQPAPQNALRRTAAPSPAVRDLLSLQSAAGNAAVQRRVRQERSWYDQGAESAEEFAAGFAPEAPVTGSSVAEVLSSPGRPLPHRKRTEMEARLGADFRRVRIHTDAVAQRSAKEMRARAWTSGEDIVLTPDGSDDHTLAHELTHVIQQRKGPVAGTDRGDGTRVSDPSDRFEREAEANAHRVMSAPVPEVQRAPAACGHDHAHDDGTPVQRVSHYQTGPTELPSDDDNYDSQEDNFDTRYLNSLPRPTSESTVAGKVAQGSSDKVTLWRGEFPDKAQTMVSNRSAGGAAQDKDAAAPTEEQAQYQAQSGRYLPEFTTSKDYGAQYSRNSVLVVVKIKAKYLTKCSESENGWAALPSAPVDVVAVVDRTRGQAIGHRANAS
ncbi:eCIS core domain-containing protein [Streptomyces carpaticus]|uniref:DUF4765 family protein n=1 Tax=Streptomyces carpaticus TaxID=285558 RepID=A0ABV4ZPP2_9ACTN